MNAIRVVPFKLLFKNWGVPGDPKNGGQKKLRPKKYPKNSPVTWTPKASGWHQEEGWVKTQTGGVLVRKAPAPLLAALGRPGAAAGVGEEQMSNQIYSHNRSETY